MKLVMQIDVEIYMISWYASMTASPIATGTALLSPEQIMLTEIVDAITVSCCTQRLGTSNITPHGSLKAVIHSDKGNLLDSMCCCAEQIFNEADRDLLTHARRRFRC
ncbi:unnamed protein product [Cylicocyclus nassatus]|uniref:Uncharacterized protein n=1 Tax=Cylicocyclus nassatus TaxID=53992 RepID=A0AA36H1Y6_CYLNA|nr:unnamed protein product [Cylicocyclus nassatus]